MARPKKPVNLTNLPQFEIDNLTRSFLPDMMKFFESKEGQSEYENWLMEEENAAEKIPAA